MFENGFLGEIALADPRRTRRAGLAQVGVRHPTLLNRLGQIETRCYRCGVNPPRLMTPGTAGAIPGYCVEVAASECGAAPTSTPTSGTTALPSDGPTRITVLVKEPTELRPYTGGADVLIEGYNVRTWTQISEIARGKTDANGTYSWQGQAPSPNTEYRFRVTVSIPGGWRKVYPDIPARTAAAAASGSGRLSASQVVAAVCPGNVDPLVCAVAEAQMEFQAIYEGQILAWGSSEQGKSFALDQAHANVRLNHPRLQQYWPTFSWWIGDLGIPPKDWPALIENFEQTMAIFSAIPFPSWPGIEDLFERCAKGVPIGLGKNAERFSVISPRLYSATWSSYFPRSDKQIEKDMAAAYLMGLQPIFACMEHRIKQKIKETQRTMRTMSVISYAITMINLPFLIAAGAGGFGALAVETYDFIRSSKEGSEPLGYGVTAALAAASLAAGNAEIVAAALEPVVNDILGNVDPTTAAAIRMIYPQVIRFAVDAVGSIATTSAQAGSTNIVQGASSFIDMSGIASAISVMVVKAMSALPKMYAADRIEQLQDTLAGAQMAAQDLLIFVSGEEVSDNFKPFLIWVVEAMGLIEAVNEAIDDFLDQFQQALESGEQQGGGVTVVPEAGGGGPAVTPTNPEGVPTDVTGTPLPGGEAPLTPPSGGGTAPGVPAPPMPPLPTTTAVGEAGTLTAAAGVGGATLALLLATGAFS